MSTHSMTPGFSFLSRLLRCCSLSCFVDCLCDLLKPTNPSACSARSHPPSVTVTLVSSLCVSVLSCSLRLAAYTAALALDALSSVATSSDTATATIDPAQDSPSSETTTLTCSLSTPANEPSDPSPGPLPAPAPTPESNAALPTPVISSSTIEAKMAPLVEQRGCDASEEQDRTTPPPVTPDWTRPQKPGTPIPPKRRHSPKLAALHAKGSPPVSPLAASSPSVETKKRAPGPPVAKLPAKPDPVAFDTETPAQPGSPSTKPESELVPDPSEGGHIVNDPRTQPDDDAPRPKTARVPALVADVPSPLPITPIISVPAPARTDAPAANDFLTPLSDTYDLLTPEAGPKNADLELELTNGTARASLIPEDLISLESPPSLPNGDGADLPLTGPAVEASEALAKTAPPVNDEYGSL